MPTIKISSGPWKYVRDSNDPADDSADSSSLQDAQNMYPPDPNALSGFYARTGFLQTAPTFVTTAGQPSALYTMTSLDGTVNRFGINSGKLYRFTATDYATSADVSPTGITINSASTATTRVFMASFADELVVSDGVNRPWTASSVSSTPVTATYIDFNGTGSAWTCQGKPTTYAGALFFIVRTCASSGSNVVPGIGIIWSEPFEPLVGYEQSGYANFWNLVQQNTNPLYALTATENYLYYFRESSIGAVTGAPGANFSSTASGDLISANVGCTAPESIVQFGDNIFFLDRIGRPHMFAPGGPVKELWKQLRGVIEDNPDVIAHPDAVKLCGIGSFIPQLNVVVLSGWSSSALHDPPLAPNTLYAFDANSGAYYGRWSAAASSTIVAFDAIAPMKTAAGAPTMGVFSANGSQSHVHLLSLLSDDNWKDGGYVPTITAKTQRLGDSADMVMNASDVGTIITQSSASCTVSVITPYTSSTTQATAVPRTDSQDGTHRVVFGMDVRAARGIQVTVQPVSAEDQFIIQSISFPASQSKAGVSEQ